MELRILQNKRQSSSQSGLGNRQQKKTISPTRSAEATCQSFATEPGNRVNLPPKHNQRCCSSLEKELMDSATLPRQMCLSLVSGAQPNSTTIIVIIVILHITKRCSLGFKYIFIYEDAASFSMHQQFSIKALLKAFELDKKILLFVADLFQFLLLQLSPTCLQDSSSFSTLHLTINSTLVLFILMIPIGSVSHILAKNIINGQNFATPY